MCLLHIGTICQTLIISLIVCQKKPRRSNYINALCIRHQLFHRLIRIPGRHLMPDKTDRLIQRNIRVDWLLKMTDWLFFRAIFQGIILDITQIAVLGSDSRPVLHLIENRHLHPFCFLSDNLTLHTSANTNGRLLFQDCRFLCIPTAIEKEAVCVPICKSLRPDIGVLPNEICQHPNLIIILHKQRASIIRAIRLTNITNGFWKCVNHLFIRLIPVKSFIDAVAHPIQRKINRSLNQFSLDSIRPLSIPDDCHLILTANRKHFLNIRLLFRRR